MKTSVLRGMQYKDIRDLERQLINRLREMPRHSNQYDVLDIQTNLAWVQKVRQEKESDSRKDER